MSERWVWPGAVSLVRTNISTINTNSVFAWQNYRLGWSSFASEVKKLLNPTGSSFLPSTVKHSKVGYRTLFLSKLYRQLLTDAQTLHWSSLSSASNSFSWLKLCKPKFHVAKICKLSLQNFFLILCPEILHALNWKSVADFK